jgi:hypothetical protein
MANNIFGFKSFLSKIPNMIELKDQAIVPTDEAVPPHIPLDLA